MCSALARQGHDVTLYVPDRKPVQAEDPFAYFGIPQEFRFRRLPCVDALRFAPLGKAGFWIQTFTFLWSLRRALREAPPSVVYSRELWLFAFPGVPGRHAWESHALPASVLARRLARRLGRIVTLTAASRRRLVEDDGIPEGRVLVEPDAVDPALFMEAPSRDVARSRLGIPAASYVCLYTGKFTTMGMPKGLDESVAAVRRLAEEGRGVQLVAVGGTPEELARYAPQASDRVRLVGHQPQRTLKDWYAAADLLLMPFPHTEHYAYYMSPLKLFEYLRSGKPMIVTDLPSVREIVSESSAFFAAPGDAASLAAEIRRAMDDPSDAAVRAGRAAELSERYTWAERARRIAAFLAADGGAL